MKTTLHLLLAASPAMAELAAHLPLSLPSLTAGVYFFPVSTSAKVAPGRPAYGAPIRVADPVGVWAVEAPTTTASPDVAACRPADVRDAADDRVARRCDGTGPGGLLVSMKDSGVAFACYCGASEDAAAADQEQGEEVKEEAGSVAAAQTEDQRGWNKRGDDDAQRGWNKRGDDDAQRGWNKRGDDDAQRGWNKRGDDDAQRGWNKRADDDSTEQVSPTGVQRGWHKRADAAAVVEPQDQRGWNKRSGTDKPVQAQDQRGWNKRADAAAVVESQDQRGWNKRSGTDKPVQATGVQRGWHRRAMAQRGML